MGFREDASFSAILIIQRQFVRRQQHRPDLIPPIAAALNANDPVRQGPTLAGVYGRKVGSIESYHYTPGYQTSELVWNDENLDKYLTNPQAMLPGSTMAYRQSKPEVRHKIIDFLKGQH